MSQNLDKEDIHIFFDMLDKEIDKDLEQPPIKFTLIAVGGTSLVLRDIKLSTKDFDFMVKDIDLKKVKKYITNMREKKTIKTDIWDFPHVFSTTLPMDASSDVYLERYKNFDVRLINLIDNAVTKLSRFNEPDRGDIDLIISSGIRPMDIMNRFNEVLRKGGFPNIEEANNKLKIFEILYMKKLKSF